MPNENIFKELLKEDFNWENFSWETYIGLGQEVLDNKKLSHRLLGRLAAEIDSHYPGSLKEFSKEVGVSYGGLRAYKSIDETFFGEEVPEDMSWGALLALAKQPDPKVVLKEVLEHGLSNAEIIKTYGARRIKKEIVCPQCGNKISDEHTR